MTRDTSTVSPGSIPSAMRTGFLTGSTTTRERCPGRRRCATCSRRRSPPPARNRTPAAADHRFGARMSSASSSGRVTKNQPPFASRSHSSARKRSPSPSLPGSRRAHRFGVQNGGMTAISSALHGSAPRRCGAAGRRAGAHRAHPAPGARRCRAARSGARAPRAGRAAEAPAGAAARSRHRPHPPPPQHRPRGSGDGGARGGRRAPPRPPAPPRPRGRPPRAGVGDARGRRRAARELLGPPAHPPGAVPVAVPRRAPQHRAHGLARRRPAAPARRGVHPGVRRPAPVRARLRRRALRGRRRRW